MNTGVDWPYIVLLLLLLYMTIMEGIQRNSVYYKISVLIVFLFIGLRAPVVGADTLNYYRYFTGEQNYYQYNDDRVLEFLFFYYNRILGYLFFHQGQLFIMFNTLLSFIFIERIVSKYSKYKTLSVLSFFLLYQYSLYFVTLRQVLGLSFMFFAIIYLLEDGKKKWLVFILSTIIAFNFHTSNIIFVALVLIVYFVPINQKEIAYILIVSSLLIGIYIGKTGVGSLLNFYLGLGISATDRLQGYIINQREWMTEDKMSYLALIKPSLISLIIIYHIKQEQVNHWFTKIYLLSVCIYNLFYSMPIVLRLNTGLSVFVIILISWSFPRFILKTSHNGIKKMVLIFIILYTARIFTLEQINWDIDSQQRMHPYCFFFENYSNHPTYNWDIYFRRY